MLEPGGFISNRHCVSVLSSNVPIPDEYRPIGRIFDRFQVSPSNTVFNQWVINEGNNFRGVTAAVGYSLGSAGGIDLVRTPKACAAPIPDALGIVGADLIG